MSVIDFISVRRRTQETKSGEASLGATALAGKSVPTLSANQFTRHLNQIAEDETRRALKRQVDVIDPREMIDLAKMLAELKAKYVAMTLTYAGNRTPMTDAEIEQLRSLRLRLQELEAAYAEVNDTVAQQLVEVRGVAREN
ncbi:MAG: hypothetical protein KDE14_10335 [Rhodobacteraceae bacterium]|nr:hypothetical protein [Paracoccaceae bacterium]